MGVRVFSFFRNVQTGTGAGCKWSTSGSTFGSFMGRQAVSKRWLTTKEQGCVKTQKSQHSKVVNSRLMAACVWRHCCLVLTPTATWLTCVPGGHQDNRQVAAGHGEPAEGLPRGGHHEAARPSAYYQAVPGQSHSICITVRLCMDCRSVGSAWGEIWRAVGSCGVKK